MASPIPFILTADPVKLRGDNVFRILFQVTKGLHQRANKCKEQEEKHGFSNLASRVEEWQFTDKIYRPFISRKNGARGRTIRKVMERGGDWGIF